jgi:nicotinamidase-related amidase
MCVLFTVQDAYLRDYSLAVPGDCVASQDAAAHERALLHMRDVLRANVRPSSELALRRPRTAAPGG